MTHPGENLGDAHVEVRADFDPARRDVKEFLREEAQRGDIRQTGESIGESVGDGVATGVRTSRPKMKKAFEDATADWEEIPKQRVKRIARYFRDKATGDVKVKYFLEELARDAYNEVTKGNSGGIFQKTGQAIRDAVGSGFNVSGKSPLIVLLLPAIGMIAHLIAGLLPAVYALTGALYTLPALLGSIALQAGVLMLAFNGVKTAMGAAFASKNIEELNAAVKDLTPSAQATVKALIPLRDLINSLKRPAQEQFFKALGFGTFVNIVQQLGPILRTGVPQLAAALGRLFRQFTDFFSSPAFVQFLEKVIPATIRWLDRFGPGFITFLTGLLNVSVKFLPLLEAIGRGVATALTKLGQFLTNMANSKDTDDFIATAKELLKLTAGVLLAIGEFIITFISEFSKEGGKEILVTLYEFFKFMTAFLKSSAGQAALKGLALAIIGLSAAFVALFIIIGIVFAALDAVFEFLGFVLMAVVITIQNLWEKFRAVALFIGVKFAELKKSVEDFLAPFLTVKDVIVNALSDTYNWLIDAGKNLVRGFIDGIDRAIPGLGGVVKHMLKAGVDRFMPHSPPKEGPLSGSGWTYYSGKAVVKAMSDGMKDETQALSSVSNQTMGAINFGPGAIRVNAQGAMTPEQARVTGTAVGNGAIDAILLRNTQLAIRTL